DRAALRARPGQLRDPSREGAQGLRARLARAGRAEDGELQARPRGLPVVERRHARGGRARRIRDHGGPELGGPQKQRAHDRGRRGGGRTGVRRVNLSATRRQVLRWLAGAPVAAMVVPAAPARARSAVPLYRDASAPIAERVRDLLGRMTLEEKVAQMIAIWARKEQVMDVL